MPPNAEPLTVYGDAAKFRAGLVKKTARGRELLSLLDAAESRIQPPPPGLTGFALRAHQGQHDGVADALLPWERSLRQLLRRHLGAPADDLFPRRPLDFHRHRQAPAADILAEQRALIESRLGDIAAVSQRLPGRRVDTAPPQPPLSPELRASELLPDDVLDGYVRRMSKTAKPAERSEAIGAVKELLEAVFKATLDLTSGAYKTGDEMPTLSREVRRGLKSKGAAPTPEAVHMLDRMFSGLSSVEQALAELRNVYGSGMAGQPTPRVWHSGTLSSRWTQRRLTSGTSC